MTTITRLVMLGILAVGLPLLAQSDPAHPFPNHEMPPAGWFCVPADTPQRVATDAHACDCMGMIDDDPMCSTMQKDEDGTEHEVPASNDNARCKVYCHKDHCTCLRLCEGS